MKTWHARDWNVQENIYSTKMRFQERCSLSGTFSLLLEYRGNDSDSTAGK